MGSNMKSRILNLIIDGESFSLDKDRILIGRAENCDLIIDKPEISHYHALAFVQPNGSVSIQDLQSINGTYINGSKVSNSALFDGDVLSLGSFNINTLESDTPIQVHSFESSTMDKTESLGDKVYIPTQHNESDILIDDEYCDIKFQDDNFVPLYNSPLKNINLKAEEYIENDDLESGYEILEKVDGHCIQITTSLSGNILEQFYFPIQDGTIYASSAKKEGTVLIDLLSSKKKQAFLKVNNGKITVNKNKLFKASHPEISTDINNNEILVLSCGTYQIFVEVAPAPSKLLHISSLRRDKEFFKDTAKKFTAAIVPMLLLLLVDFQIEKKQPPKQLSIIYKKPTTANVDGQKMASTNPNDLKKNTGHKEQKQPDKKIAHSKAGKKAQPKKATPKKAAPKKVAKATPKKSAPSKSKAKTKAYTFKMASNVSSVFSKSNNVKVAASASSTSVNTSASVSGSLATKVNGTSSNNVGNMGSDSAGRALASYGSKGLSSKSGRDTAYIQTETVVLGSMDPELLRKILQQYLPQFRHCYQQELVYNSDDIKGIVDLNFEITGAGKVSKIRVKAKDSRFSKKGTNCMAKVLAIIDFPKPKGGGRVAVRQPLSFYAEQEKS